VLAGLTTGHTVGLAVVAAVFILFALSASFLAPRRWPDFPGRNGLSVFIIVSLVLFGSMLTAIEVFGVEKPEAAEAAKRPAGGEPKQTIQVTETDARITLPELKQLQQGTYEFQVKNAGQKPHNLVIEGPKAVGQTELDTIQPGETAHLIVSFAQGTYTLYSSEDGDRANGLTATINVG
jgi:hypothetical protein